MALRGYMLLVFNFSSAISLCVSFLSFHRCSFGVRSRCFMFLKHERREPRLVYRSTVAAAVAAGASCH